MSIHATAHGGCRDTVRESALEVDWGENVNEMKEKKKKKKEKEKNVPHRGLEPASVCTAVWGCQYREHEAREDLEQIRAILILHLTSGFSGFTQMLLLASCDVTGLESCKFQQKVSWGT